MLNLNGWSKFYRQTLVFSEVQAPQINALFNKHCRNWAGKMQLLRSDVTPAVSQIVIPMSQVCTLLAPVPHSNYLVHLLGFTGCVHISENVIHLRVFVQQLLEFSVDFIFFIFTDVSQNPREQPHRSPRSQTTILCTKSTENLKLIWNIIFRRFILLNVFRSCRSFKNHQ